MAGLIQRYVDGRVQVAIDNLVQSVSETTPVLYDEAWRQARNRVFYYADSEELLRFYKTRYPKDYLTLANNNFYRILTGNTKLPFMHYPLAPIITKTMVNLLFGSNPDIKVVTDNKSKTDEFQELVDNIENEVELGTLLQKACEYESYSGCVAFKPVIDPDFSEYPFFIPYPKEDIEIVKKYDRVTEIIFKDIYEQEKRYFYLYTICGKGYIDYKLYSGKKQKGNYNEVPLTTLEETKDLHRIDFYSKGKKYNRILAIYKENKTNAQSDYWNNYDDFAALDEIYTNMVNFVRKSKLVTYRPENTLEINEKTGKPIIPNDYSMEDIILHDNNPEGTKQEIKRDWLDIENPLSGYVKAFNNTLLSALATAGLSPASIGLDSAGANSSAEALNIRERVSLRTRDEKSKRWCKAIKDMFILLIELSTIKLTGETAYVDEFEGDISVTFGEYESPTFDEKVTSLSQALQNNLIDLESALRMLYPEKTDDEIELMKMQIEGQLLDEQELVEKNLREDEKEDKEEE